MEETEVLVANNVELDRVFKVKYKLPKNPQNYTWQCLKCKKPLFYNKYLNCFKHRGQKPEGFEPETIEHKTMKDYWYRTFPLYNPIKTRMLEYWLGDQVADVYFELRENGEKVAIEFHNHETDSNSDTIIDYIMNYLTNHFERLGILPDKSKLDELRLKKYIF